MSSSYCKLKTSIRSHHTPIRRAKIQKTDNTECWRGCAAVGTVIHSLLVGRQMVLLLWKTVGWSLTKRTTVLGYDPSAVLLGVSPMNLKTYSWANLPLNVSSSHSQYIFDLARCPSIGKWIHCPMVGPSTHTTEYYSAIKKEMSAQATKRLGGILDVLSRVKRSQSEKTTYCLSYSYRASGKAKLWKRARGQGGGGEGRGGAQGASKAVKQFRLMVRVWIHDGHFVKTHKVENTEGLH